MSSIKPYVSVFTPSHRPTYLNEAYASLHELDLVFNFSKVSWLCGWKVT